MRAAGVFPSFQCLSFRETVLRVKWAAGTKSTGRIFSLSARPGSKEPWGNWAVRVCVRVCARASVNSSAENSAPSNHCSAQSPLVKVDRAKDAKQCQKRKKKERTRGRAPTRIGGDLATARWILREKRESALRYARDLPSSQEITRWFKIIIIILLKNPMWVLCHRSGRDRRLVY